MDSKSTFAHFVRQWDGHDHIHFINWAYRYYHKIRSGTSYHSAAPPYYSRYYNRGRTREGMISVIDRLYRIGRYHHVLDADAITFWKKLDPEGWSPPRGSYSHKVYKRSEKYEDYYPRTGAHFRQKVPLRIADKKVISEKEQSQRDWREKKQIRRERANHGGWAYGKSRGKTYAKMESNRCFRRHEKSEIHHGRYEDLFMRKRKDYFDSWDWD